MVQLYSIQCLVIERLAYCHKNTKYKLRYILVQPGLNYIVENVKLPAGPINNKTLESQQRRNPFTWGKEKKRKRMQEQRVYRLRSDMVRVANAV